VKENSGGQLAAAFAIRTEGIDAPAKLVTLRLDPSRYRQSVSNKCKEASRRAPSASDVRLIIVAQPYHDTLTTN
jgi:hypothetical protein